MLVQQRYACESLAECRLGPTAAMARLCGGSASRCLLEAKVHVVFGRLTSLTVGRVPDRADGSLLHLTLDRGGAVARCAALTNASSRIVAAAATASGDELRCNVVVALLRPALDAVAEAAARLSSALLADWLRLDVFVGHPTLGLRVNDVSYPSRRHDAAALEQWLRKYRELQAALLPKSGAELFQDLAALLGLENASYFDTGFGTDDWPGWRQNVLNGSNATTTHATSAARGPVRPVGSSLSRR